MTSAIKSVNSWVCHWNCSFWNLTVMCLNRCVGRTPSRDKHPSVVWYGVFCATISGLIIITGSFSRPNTMIRLWMPIILAANPAARSQFAINVAFKSWTAWVSATVAGSDFWDKKWWISYKVFNFFNFSIKWHAKILPHHWKLVPQNPLKFFWTFQYNRTNMIHVRTHPRTFLMFCVEFLWKILKTKGNNDDTHCKKWNLVDGKSFPWLSNKNKFSNLNSIFQINFFKKLLIFEKSWINQ